MPMAMTQEAKHSQNFMLTMNVKEEELSDSEYFPEEQEDDFMTVSQFSLRSRRKALHSPPSVEHWEPLEAKKNVFNTRRSHFSPTHTTQRCVARFGDFRCSLYAFAYSSVCSAPSHDNPNYLDDDIDSTIVFNPLNKELNRVPGDPQQPGSYKRKRNMFDNSQDHESAINQVQEMLANLGAKCPSFVKSMIRSNVSSCFCLTLPKQFCHLHLPLHDTTITLEIESGEKYRTLFLVGKRILSAGWRKFCFANNLTVGDLLVFRLVRPLKFKVFIMGRVSLAEVDAAFNLLKLNACAKQEVFGENHPTPLPRDICQGNFGKTSPTLDTNPELVDNQYEDDNDEFGSNFQEEIRFRRSPAGFRDDRSIENFTILVNGVSIDSRLPEHLRNNYYDLCCSQKTFLHDHLLKSINSKLAAEIITETTKIANAIRACKLPPFNADYAVWEKTLNAFELLGMNVGFLRARLKRLLIPSFKSEEAMEAKRRYIEAKVEQVFVREEMRALDSELLGLKEKMASLDAKMEALKEISERRERIFQEEVDAPW